MKQALIHGLIVGAGGFIGSILRYAVSGLIHRWLPFATFPWGTLTVNLVGCLAIGLLSGLVDVRQMLGPSARLFLMLGLLGGFTTFSTFGIEAYGLMADGEHFKAASSVVIHVVAGVGAAWLGYALVRGL